MSITLTIAELTELAARFCIGKGEQAACELLKAKGKSHEEIESIVNFSKPQPETEEGWPWGPKEPDKRGAGGRDRYADQQRPDKPQKS